MIFDVLISDMKFIFEQFEIRLKNAKIIDSFFLMNLQRDLSNISKKKPRNRTRKI